MTVDSTFSHAVSFNVLPSFQRFSVFFSFSVVAHVAISLSLLRMWLSRSTSKTDALDDDETPLRLTSSQTATTRGVMVSGIVGALDIAPMLHFVEPGLKISGGFVLLSRSWRLSFICAGVVFAALGLERFPARNASLLFSNAEKGERTSRKSLGGCDLD